jgi:hypothetical protein
VRAPCKRAVLARAAAAWCAASQQDVRGHGSPAVTEKFNVCMRAPGWVCAVVGAAGVDRAPKQCVRAVVGAAGVGALLSSGSAQSFTLLASVLRLFKYMMAVSFLSSLVETLVLLQVTCPL